MKNWVVKISRVETYSMCVVVEAENLDEAIKKVEKKWDDDDYLYEKLQDCQDDTDTKFRKLGEASENDLNSLPNI